MLHPKRPRSSNWSTHLPAKRGGPEALADHRSRPDCLWNRIPDDVRSQIIDLVKKSRTKYSVLSPHMFAMAFNLTSASRFASINSHICCCCLEER
jgi:hypothetical protein